MVMLVLQVNNPSVVQKIRFVRGSVFSRRGDLFGFVIGRLLHVNCKRAEAW